MHGQIIDSLTSWNAREFHTMDAFHKIIHWQLATSLCGLGRSMATNRFSIQATGKHKSSLSDRGCEMPASIWSTTTSWIDKSWKYFFRKRVEIWRALGPQMIRAGHLRRASPDQQCQAMKSSSILRLAFYFLSVDPHKRSRREKWEYGLFIK